MHASINPYYPRRTPNRPAVSLSATTKAEIKKIVIGDATLYRADCFDVLPMLRCVDTVITDPPFGIGYKVSQLRRRAGQVSLADDATSARITACDWQRAVLCMAVPDQGRSVAQILPTRISHRRRLQGVSIPIGHEAHCMAWDPVIFFSGRSRIYHELPRDWHVAQLAPWDDSLAEKPGPLSAAVGTSAVFLRLSGGCHDSRSLHGKRHYGRCRNPGRQALRRHRARPRVFRVRLSADRASVERAIWK